MFTGIVEELGSIREVSLHRLVVTASKALEGAAVGDSISVNGACLTIVDLASDYFSVDLSEETLIRTNIGSLKGGDSVNLERALTPESRMGGHIVQGHVDGVGKVVELTGSSGSQVLRVAAPPELSRYIVEKGFIAIDGISLTVTAVADPTFSVAVIPYTAEQTVLRDRAVGDLVNLEIDIIAKYVERLLPKR